LKLFKDHVYVKGEYICKSGDTLTKLVFIGMGRVRMFNSKRDLDDLEEGCFYGQDNFIENLGTKLHNDTMESRSPVSIQVSSDKCLVLYLDINDIVAELHKFPVDKKTIIDKIEGPTNLKKVVSISKHKPKLKAQVSGFLTQYAPHPLAKSCENIKKPKKPNRNISAIISQLKTVEENIEKYR